MNELVVADRASEWRRLKSLVLDSVSSPITRRVYNLGLDEFIAWYMQEPRPAGFTKATVTAWRVALEARKLGPISINVRITAVRKLAVEAADNGLLAPELASGIARIKGVRSHGVRVGNWLSLRQAQALLNAPDVRTKKGLRDRAMFATLLGCGLRRSELANLTMKHVQQRDNRWCIVDLVGKHGRVRTIPMPTWTKNAIDAWTVVAGVTEGHLFRPVNRGDQVSGERLSEKVVWQMLVPGRGRRTGTDSDATRAFVGPNYGALPRDETGSGSRAERCDQVEIGSVRVPGSCVRLWQSCVTLPCRGWAQNQAQFFSPGR
jgi:site-specific recombinase XerD